MSNSFLPETYEAPKSNSNYLKLEEGENKLRILSRPLLGYLDWENNKPLRFPMDKKPSKPIDPAKPVKHFWAMPVWDYKTESVKILEITQASIQTAITNLSKDTDWGSPLNYDIKINKKGKGKETEYSVIALPHKNLPGEINFAFDKAGIVLEKLFTNENPFTNE